MKSAWRERRLTRLRLGYAIALACLPTAVSGQEYDSLPAAPSALPVASDHVLYLTLTVNGRPDDQITSVLVKGDHYWIDGAALMRNHLKLEGQEAGAVNVSALANVKVQYDEPGQRLLLQVPGAWLPVQDIRTPNLIDGAEAQGQSGLLFNYDLYGQNSGNTRYLSAWLEQRWFNPLGYLTNTGSWWQPLGSTRTADRDHYLRYDTYWRYSNQDAMVSIQVGDLASNALTWSSSVRMGGIRVSRDFSLRPDLVTWPVLQYSGTAALPGSVDLFVNGYKASSNNINAGPFTITNVPFINGAGEATVITTDALGRQVSTSVPFYVANTLLRQGLTDFDFSAGALRQNYGIDNASYGAGAVSGIYRYGLFNSLTLSGHGEASNDLTLLGAGADIAVGRLGTLSASLSQSASQSQGENNSGRQHSLAYSYNGRHFGFSAQHIQRNHQYRDLSVLDSDYALSQRSDQFTFNMAPGDGGFGTFSAGYFDIQAADSSRTRLANLSWSKGLMWNSNLYVSLNKTLGENGYSTMLQWMVPFDFGNATASVQRDTAGGYSPRMTLSHSTPTEGGIGWNLAWGGGTSDYRQADMSWQNTYTTLKGGVWQQDGEDAVWANSTGSVILMDGALFATNKVNDGFLLISTDGYPDVPVLYENQRLGNTDSNGHMLIPWANGWYPSKIEISTLDLPVDVEAPVVEQRVAVRAGSGALVKFPVHRVRSASLSLTDSAGIPIPVGALATEINSGTQGVVGFGGQLWLSHLPVRNDLRIALANGEQCQLSFTLSDSGSGYATLGTLPCLPVSHSRESDP